MTDKTDRVMPEGRWEFDADVTDVFDDMLARSIPWYDVMRGTCYDVACQFVKPGTDIVDLGCSRGGAMETLLDKFGAHNRFWGVDVSEPMLEAARQRFAGFLKQPGGRPGIVKILNMDLRKEYPPVAASVTMCVLTLQFTPIEYRLKILRNIYKHTLGSGALILVEKVLGSTAELDELMVMLYYDMKRVHGYTEDQIQRKKLSLEGVLVPVTAKMNEEMLRSAGFSQIDCFWRWMNFSGWVAVKE